MASKKPNKIDTSIKINRSSDKNSKLADMAVMYLNLENKLHKFGKNVVGWPSGKAINFVKYLLKSLALSPDCGFGRFTRSVGGDFIKNEYVAQAKVQLWDDASKYRVLIPLAILIPIIKHLGIPVILAHRPSNTLDLQNKMMFGIIIGTLLSLLGYDYYNDSKKQAATAILTQETEDPTSQDQDLTQITVVALEPSENISDSQDLPEEITPIVLLPVADSEQIDTTPEVQTPTEPIIPVVLTGQEEIAQELPVSTIETVTTISTESEPVETQLCPQNEESSQDEDESDVEPENDLQHDIIPA